MLLLVWGCSKDSIEQGSQVQSDAPSAQRSIKSGEQLFQEIFFLKGELASHSQLLGDLKTETEKRLSGISVEDYSEMTDAISEDVIDYVDAKYPIFFQEFQEAMYSENLFLMKQYIEDGAQKLLEAGNNGKYSTLFQNAYLVDTPEFQEFVSTLDLNTEEGKEKLAKYLDEIGIIGNGGNQEICCSVGALVCVVYIAVVAHSYVAATATVVAVAIAWVKIGAADGIVKGGGDSGIEGLCVDISSYLSSK